MLTFPAGLRPISGGFGPIAKTLSGGMSLAAIEQVVSTMADRWGATYTFPIRADADVLAVRALLMRLRGRANSIALPAFDLARAPWGRDAYGRQQTPRAMRTPQLDGTPYGDNPAALRDSLIDAKVLNTAAAQSTTLRITMLRGGEPLPGHMFSIAARLYAIEDAAPVSVVGSTGVYDLSIWPWIRDDVPALSSVNFTSPVCEMRLASDGEGVDALRGLDVLRFGKMTLNFDEAP